MTLPRALNRGPVRKMIAWLPMYVCYYAGEIAFQILDRWPGEWSDEKHWHDVFPNALYQVYQRGMALSCDLNDWAGFRLWYKEGEIK